MAVRPATLGNLVLRSIIAIGAGLLLGLLIDDVFQLFFRGSQSRHLQLFLQLLVNVVVVVALRVLSPRVGFDVADNVFFIAIFIGAQQSLFWKINELYILPQAHPAGRAVPPSWRRSKAVVPLTRLQGSGPHVQEPV